ncbi:hypothetical protein FCL53_10810 [Elizabethkingia meningoseptica]|uniref:tape measure protein n=1 Tax=Elizabethkingia meningoseptica TaxID=238 RepID=UPI00136536F1|nr:tape measure protein [Elizabethkingia meningoseptica]MVW92455.1 hypothetical protein [Elizabethkingia meningoseptica]
MAELNVGIGADISELVGKIDEVKKKIQSSFKSIDLGGLEDAFKSLETSLRQVGAQNEVFGKSLANSKKELAAYQKAFNDLIAQGLKPTHPEVLKLADEIDRLTKEIDQAEKPINDLNKSLDSLNGVIASLGLSRLVTQITNFTKAAIKAYGEMESLELGLQSVMGGADKAAVELEKLKEVAKLPGLSFKEAVQGSVNLQSAGFSADMSRRALMAFGNALAIVGKGGNELGMVNLALTQLQNKTGGFGQDIRQLMEQLPQLKTALTSAFGTADTEAIQNMGYTGAQVVEKLIKEFEKIPLATGGINNAFENMDDAINQAMASIGKDIAESINLKGLIESLAGAVGYLAQAFRNLDPETKKLIVVTAGVTTAILSLTSAALGIAALLPSITAGLAAMGTTLGALTGYIGLAVVAIVAITAVVLKLTQETREASARQEEFQNAMAGAEVSAKRETSALDALIAKARDEKLSRKERIDAVKEIQNMYPNYFGNLSDERIMVGNISKEYRQLATDIYNASRVRASQKIIENAAQKQLENEIRLTKERNAAVAEARKTEAAIQDAEKKGATLSAAIMLIDARRSREIAREKQIQLDDNKKFLDKYYSIELSIVKDNEASLTRIQANEAKAREIQLKETSDKALKSSKEYRDAQKKAESEAKKQKNKEAREAESEAKKAANREKSLFNSQMNAAIDNAKKKLKFEEEVARDRELLMQNLDAKRASYEKDRAANRLKGEEEIFQAHKAMIEQYDEMLRSNIADSISSFGENIGEAMANGTSLISAAGAGLLAGLGSFSQMLGKEMIKLGVQSISLGNLMIAIKKAIKNPWALVAAGVAAVAIGGLLNSAASNAQNSINSSGGGLSGTSTSTATGANTTSYSSNFGSQNGFSGGEVVFRISGNDLVGVLEREQDRRGRTRS